jgi:hypothetical protein
MDYIIMAMIIGGSIGFYIGYFVRGIKRKNKVKSFIEGGIVTGPIKGSPDLYTEVIIPLDRLKELLKGYKPKI